MPAPFNPAKHAELIEQGYARYHMPCSFSDDGYPDLCGYPAYDEYRSSEDLIVIDDTGEVVHREDHCCGFDFWLDD